MVNLFCTSRQIILASQSPRRQHFLKELGIEYTLYHELLFTKEEKNKKNSTDINIHFGAKPKLSVSPETGVRAKDDKEERPKPFELPENYVLRTALGKALDAMQSAGFIQATSSVNEDKKLNSESPNNKVNAKFDAILNMDKKESLNLSYLVEKYSFRPNIIYPATSLTDKGSLKSPLFITADTIVALDDEILGKPYDEADALDMLSRMVGRKHNVLTTVCVADLDANCVYSFTDIAHVHFASWSTQLLESYVKTGDPMDKAGSYGIQGVGMFLSDGIQGSWDTVAGLPVAKLLELLLHCEAIHIAPQ